MKKLLTIYAILIFSGIIYAQNPYYIDSTLIFDISQTSSSNPILYYIDYEVQSTIPGQWYVVQFRFDSLDCTGEDLLFDMGAHAQDSLPPVFASGYGEIMMPLVLDTTKLREQPYKEQLFYARYPWNGRNQWTFGLKYQYDRGVVTYVLINEDPATCTKGYVWKIR